MLTPHEGQAVAKRGQEVLPRGTLVGQGLEKLLASPAQQHLQNLETARVPVAHRLKISQRHGKPVDAELLELAGMEVQPFG